MARFVDRARTEPVEVVDYDPAWPARFEEEAARLRALLPGEQLDRIEHIGSTAVPGLAAKPIVDVAVEIADLEHVRDEIAPLLAPHGYELFWRPRRDGLPGIEYAWFIRRDAEGRRTHHVHMIPPGSPDWDRITFRDWLRSHPETARAYGALKRGAAREHRHDRKVYARAKAAFIRDTLDRARQAGAG